MLNKKARCKNCNETLERLILFALMQDAGAKVSGLCKPDEHVFDRPLLSKIEEKQK